MAESSIEWTDATWNPVAGCTVISPGCTNCYAMRMAARLDAMGVAKYKSLTRKSGSRAVWTGAIRLDESALRAPLAWYKPRMIFVNSMSDLFHEKVPADFIESVWAIMARAQQHTFQVLTKRAERMAEITMSLPLLPNVWLGASVESADYFWRLDALRRTHATVRFASFEPLLGSVRHADLTGIGWAIVGGESGPRARPMNATWVQELREACRQAGTAFFFKQWGGTNKKRTGRELEGKTWDEFPITHPSEYAMRPCAPG
jgi:protein gp37